MLKVSIDSNMIINEKTLGLLAQIKQLAEKGLIDISVTTRVIADKDQDPDEARKSKHLKEFDSYIKVGTIARTNLTWTNTGDFTVDDEGVQVSQQIEKVIFGKISANDKRAHNKWADVDHLVGHYFAERDVFVTQENRMWKKRNVLREQLGIIVERPQEFLSRFPGV
ncbi:MAG TPA: hypothetical protein G4N93_03505 [Dehalococcoidia bacterium]|nr:hypothetical protein [Dehalococcoidia bacterium]